MPGRRKGNTLGEHGPTGLVRYMGQKQAFERPIGHSERFYSPRCRARTWREQNPEIARARDARYNATAKGQARRIRIRYEGSAPALERHARYNNSLKGLVRTNNFCIRQIEARLTELGVPRAERKHHRP